MRTKTKVLAALAGLVIGASAQAQVYSLNAVGYVNTTFTANKFTMFANPLDTSNSLSNLFSTFTGADDNTMIYVWDAAGKKYVSLTYSFGDGGWFDISGSDPVDANTYLLPPGQGAWFKGPRTFTNTFVGTVLTGTLTNQLYAGFTMVGSKVPQSAGATALALDTGMGDFDLYKYAYATGYTTYTFNSGTWYNISGSDPVEEIPVINVGEAVFVNSSVGHQWIRTFTLN